MFSLSLGSPLLNLHPRGENYWQKRAPHSSTLAWKIPWMEEPGRLQSIVSLRVGHNWATSLSLFTFMHWRRNGNPLQRSCLENPRGGGAWWAAIYGVTQSRTRLKQLSSSGSSSALGDLGRQVRVSDISQSVTLVNANNGFPCFILLHPESREICPSQLCTLFGCGSLCPSGWLHNKVGRAEMAARLSELSLGLL